MAKMVGEISTQGFLAHMKIKNTHLDDWRREQHFSKTKCFLQASREDVFGENNTIQESLKKCRSCETLQIKLLSTVPIYTSTNPAEYQREHDQVLHFFPVVHTVLHLSLSVLLVLCERQHGPRLEVGTAPRIDLLFELLFVREQGTKDRDHSKWFE